jgi:hypothetical protein
MAKRKVTTRKQTRTKVMSRKAGTPPGTAKSPPAKRRKTRRKQKRRKTRRKKTAWIRLLGALIRLLGALILLLGELVLLLALNPMRKKRPEKLAKEKLAKENSGSGTRPLRSPYYFHFIMDTIFIGIEIIS